MSTSEPSVSSLSLSSDELFSLGLERDLAHRSIFEAALADRDKQLRVIAARALGWLRAPKCAAALMNALDDPDPEVRRWVSASLSLSWIDSASDALTQRVPNELDGVVRAAMIRTLGWRRCAGASALCASALAHDEDPEVRGEAAKALGRIAPQDYISHLLKAAQDDAPVVRRHAVRALAGSTSTSELSRGASSALTDLLSIAQHDEDAEARAVAIRALTGHPAHEVYTALIRGLHDANPGVRVNAIIALGRRGDPRALPNLEEMIDDPHPEVSLRARDAIELISP